MAEEVEMEVEAVEAVYGPDCTVLSSFPPHLSILLKPRTADVLSIQFVEAKLIIKASDEYPSEPPKLDLKDAKGLGDSRHATLLVALDAQAKEMSGEPMLVAICEAATDLLTEMNVPDGECCFCMNPFLMEDGAQPFMKLMSCFHCFHSDCFGNWWRWLQQQHKASSSGVVSAPRPADSNNDERSENGNAAQVEEFPVNCPVCRMVVYAEDVAHVREFLVAERNVDNEENAEVPDSVLTAEELERRARFCAEFEAQQARGAIIEPKKLEVILPGMIVPPRTPAVEEEPPASAQGSETETPNGDQISPTSTVESPGTSSPSVSEMNRTGVEQGNLKANSQPKNEAAGRGVVRGRRGGRRGASHSVSRGQHGKAKGTKDQKQATGGPPRQFSHPASHQSVGSRKGARRGVEVDDI
ncbi:hypothetical protein R1sor_011310 [Riccia sorocarpa]|uniref:RWD domain-containing protein n=1 Tax=Riccia sorocarpa TaxID=122646 RepID=A0ABD3I6K2_9MARC